MTGFAEARLVPVWIDRVSGYTIGLLRSWSGGVMAVAWEHRCLVER
jgi:hypothetical protein